MIYILSASWVLPVSYWTSWTRIRCHYIVLNISGSYKLSTAPRPGVNHDTHAGSSRHYQWFRPWTIVVMIEIYRTKFNNKKKLIGRKLRRRPAIRKSLSSRVRVLQKFKNHWFIVMLIILLLILLRFGITYEFQYLMSTFLSLTDNVCKYFASNPSHLTTAFCTKRKALFTKHARVDKQHT